MLSPIPVALVLNTFDAGGTEHQMTELICRLDPRRFAVHAVCLGDRGALRPRLVTAGIPITEFPMWGFARPATAGQALRFARWCRAHGIQIVHTCDFYSNVFALPPATLARVPVRIASRRDVFVPERRPAHLRLQHLAYRLAHAIVANSTAAAARLRAEGFDPGTVSVIANGLDPQRFAPRPRATGPLTVTTVANLRPGKGHDVLLEAAAHVLQRHPEVHVRVVGDGPRRGALEAQASRLGIAGRVQFTGHRDDVPEVLRNTDVFAFPSLMEASPNAVLEAMAAGVATVASDVGGIPEVITHRQNGLLVAAGDARGLGAALLELIDRPDLRQQFGEAARQTVRSRFSFDRMVADVEALYLQYVSRRAGWSARRPPATAA